MKMCTTGPKAKAYSPVTSDIVGSLQEIVGESGVLTDPHEVEGYSHDETSGLLAHPEIVLKPSSTQQVSQVLALAQKERVPVTPRGGGTGLSGGSVPLVGGIVLSLERMNRIREIDESNVMVVVEPGVITRTLHEEVERKGLFYPPDPASLDSCTIGGNLAVCAGGARAVKYGVTKDYVCGIEAVLPSGQIITLGGKLVKNVAGYDLMSLLVGSEGTLAIITQVTLRLLPLPRYRVDLLAPFDTLAASAQAASEIISKKVLPTAIEIMDHHCLSLAGQHLCKEIPFGKAAAHLLIGLDGNNREAIRRDYDMIADICLDTGAEDVLVAEDRRDQDRIWEARRCLHDAVERISPITHDLDLVVPRSRIATLLSTVYHHTTRYDLRAIAFGHAGDGNVHVLILKENLSEDEWQKRLAPLLDDLYATAVELGGSISGEHGVGCIKKRRLSLVCSVETIELMQKIKLAFDPNLILNPGKIFDMP
jgi:glycolate oxidase